MKKFVRYNNSGKITAIITSNDKTLVVTDMIKINDNKLFEKVKKNINKYKVKNKKLIKKDDKKTR